jgi:hypothetical protein
VAVHPTKDAGRLGNRILREAGIRMTMLYPIALETEDNGTASAYAPGLLVYAAADTHRRRNALFARC